MKKLYLAILLMTPIVTLANSCPSVDKVFVKRGNQYIIVPPVGWELQQDKGKINHLESDDVQFSMAAWGADLHLPTDADNHVRCYYFGIKNNNNGVSIQTETVIQEWQVKSYSQWQYAGPTYYGCGTDLCPFADSIKQ